MRGRPQAEAGHALSIYIIEICGLHIPVWPDGYIIIQSLVIYNNANLPSRIKMTKLEQILNKPSTKIAQRLLKFWKSGEISPILVTLAPSILHPWVRIPSTLSMLRFNTFVKRLG